MRFLKLGGSLITDKTVPGAFRAGVVDRLAGEIAAAWDGGPLLIGHGSGSFGHVEARQYGTRAGVHTPEDWAGFGAVSAQAARLNRLVIDSLRGAGLPVIGLQPSASILCDDGMIIDMALHPILEALAGGLIPLIYGDVAWDMVRGGTIASTEDLFFYLAQHLEAAEILLAGEVAGVLDAEGTVIDAITPDNFESFRDVLGGSHGIDVTGGMFGKVRAMLELVARYPGMVVRIFGASEPGTLHDALIGHPCGTLIKS
jgi:isopentenyl phosphate kinase